MKLFFLFWNYKGTVKVWYWYSPYCIFIHIQYIIQGERGIIGSRFLILFLASVVRSIITNFSQYTVLSHSTYYSSTGIYFSLSLLKGNRQESQRLIFFFTRSFFIEKKGIGSFYNKLCNWVKQDIQNF